MDRPLVFWNSIDEWSINESPASVLTFIGIQAQQWNIYLVSVYFLISCALPFRSRVYLSWNIYLVYDVKFFSKGTFFSILALQPLIYERSVVLQLSMSKKGNKHSRHSKNKSYNRLPYLDLGQTMPYVQVYRVASMENLRQASRRLLAYSRLAKVLLVLLL